ncbi:TPM domain-containing protein [Marinobacter sp. BGYM27]|uniref:TPM domain-containing protein n=1 Tax=Marinobacter sp. BGYM27 TaxID=2975597 RepID=UPI0021A3363A|nr:TPM domain-containing protein [Marinobacter sp. BGYM27]MDG5501198.1 TPM domain-containing protein [Marinobacter sp. BGYM27]
MIFLTVAMAGLVLIALLPFTLILTGLTTFEAVPFSLYIRSLVLVTVAIALFQQRRGAWLVSVVLAIMYTVLALLAVISGEMSDWWLFTDSPRYLLLINAAILASAVATLTALLLPSTRAILKGESPNGPVEWQMLVLIMVTGLALLPTWSVWPRYPLLVDDETGLLSGEELRFISRYHGLLRTDYDIDYRIVIDEDLGDIRQYARQYYEDHSIGTASESGKGALLVVDIAADRVHLEVGEALKTVFTDAFSAYIGEQQMTGYFAGDQVAKGLMTTTEMMVTRADHEAMGLSQENEEWMAQARSEPASETPKAGQLISAIAIVETPQTVLESYRRAMTNHNNNPRLAFYTEATRDMLALRVVTPAQMDNVASSLNNCTIARRFIRDEYAVLRPPIDDRTCPPYFFKREDGKWRLDFTVMKDALLFGRGNQWRLAPKYAGPYAFAFLDLQFDANGYPYESPRRHGGAIDQ